MLTKYKVMFSSNSSLVSLSNLLDSKISISESLLQPSLEPLVAISGRIPLNKGRVHNLNS